MPEQSEYVHEWRYCKLYAWPREHSVFPPDDRDEWLPAEFRLIRPRCTGLSCVPQLRREALGQAVLWRAPVALLPEADRIARSPNHSALPKWLPLAHVLAEIDGVA